MKNSKAYNVLREMAIDGYNLATDYGYATDWYSHAREQVALFAETVAPDLPVEYVSGIIAITSANCTVRENFARAYQYLTTGNLGNCVTLCRMCDNYQRDYFTTGNPNIVGSIRKEGVLQYTDKTNEFRKNICPVNGDDNAVTVDRHIFHAVGGDSQSHRFQAIAIILKLARDLEMKPSEVQACIWYTVKWDKGHRNVGSPTYTCPFSPFIIADWLIEEKLGGAVC